MTLLHSMAVAASAVVLAGAVLAQPGGGPPPEAIAACKGKTDGAACTFTGRRGEALTGKCFTPPARPGGQQGGQGGPAQGPGGSSQGQGAKSGAPASSAMPMACRPANAPDGPGGPAR